MKHEWDKELVKDDPDSIAACTRCGLIKKKIKTRLRYYPKNGLATGKKPECK